MIPILRVLVLSAFVVLAFVLACHKEQHHMTYRLILAFVAVGATTFFPEDAVTLQVVSGFAIFFFLTVLMQITVRAHLSEKAHENETAKKRNI